MADLTPPTGGNPTQPGAPTPGAPGAAGPGGQNMPAGQNAPANPPSLIERLAGQTAPGSNGKSTANGDSANGTAATGAASGPSAPSASKSAAPATGNVFTRLFGATRAEPTALQKAGLTPPSQKQGASLSELLGPKPVFSHAAFQEAEKKRTKIAKVLLEIALLVAIGTYGFFESQLNPNFTLLVDQMGPNVAMRFDRSNAELRHAQTDLNLVRYRTARLWLDEANSQIDPFQRQAEILKSNFSTSAQKQDAEANVQVLGAQLKKSLGELQKILDRPLGVDTFSRTPVTVQEREAQYETLLKTQLVSERAALMREETPNREAIRLIDNVLRLVENKGFREIIARHDLTSISEEDFAVMLAKVREESTDELSLINKIRTRRLNWKQVIEDIHSIARTADLFFGKGLFKSNGGFLFSSYRFDAASGRVSITGLTETPDSKTFSFIADLVNKIEKSPKFKDIDFRSFAKNRDESGRFSSSLNLEFAIQREGETDPRDEFPALSRNTLSTTP